MAGLDSVRNFLLSDKVQTVISRPGFMKWSIAGFISVNMITRPLFVMLDRKTPKKDRAFSAERLGYQEMLSLACHLGIASSFEKIGAKLGAKFLKGDPDFQRKVGARTYDLSNWDKNASSGYHAFQQLKKDVASGVTTVADKTELELPKAMRGSMRLGSIVGTIAALSWVAPFVNNLTLPYVVRGVDVILGKASRGKLQFSPAGNGAAKPTVPSPAGAPQKPVKSLNTVSLAPEPGAVVLSPSAQRFNKPLRTFRNSYTAASTVPKPVGLG